MWSATSAAQAASRRSPFPWRLTHSLPRPGICDRQPLGARDEQRLAPARSGSYCPARSRRAALPLWRRAMSRDARTRLPYHVAFHPPASWATVVADGAPNLPLLRQALRGLVADPRFGPRAGVLFDLRRAAAAPTAGDAAAFALAFALAFADAAILGGRPVALLAEGPAPAGPAHAIAVLTELKGGRARAFTDEGAARDWLERLTSTARDGAP